MVFANLVKVHSVNEEVYAGVFQISPQNTTKLVEAKEIANNTLAPAFRLINKAFMSIGNGYYKGVFRANPENVTASDEVLAGMRKSAANIWLDENDFAWKQEGGRLIRVVDTDYKALAESIKGKSRRLLVQASDRTAMEDAFAAPSVGTLCYFVNSSTKEVDYGICFGVKGDEVKLLASKTYNMVTVDKAAIMAEGSAQVEGFGRVIVTASYQKDSFDAKDILGFYETLFGANEDYVKEMKTAIENLTA